MKTSSLSSSRGGATRVEAVGATGAKRRRMKSEDPKVPDREMLMKKDHENVLAKINDHLQDKYIESHLVWRLLEDGYLKTDTDPPAPIKAVHPPPAPIAAVHPPPDAIAAVHPPAAPIEAVHPPPQVRRFADFNKPELIYLLGRLLWPNSSESTDLAKRSALKNMTVDTLTLLLCFRVNVVRASVVPNPDDMEKVAEFCLNMASQQGNDIGGEFAMNRIFRNSSINNGDAFYDYKRYGIFQLMSFTVLL